MPILDTALKYPGPKYIYEYDYQNSATVADLFFNKTEYGMYKMLDYLHYVNIQG